MLTITHNPPFCQCVFVLIPTTLYTRSHAPLHYHLLIQYLHRVDLSISFISYLQPHSHVKTPLRTLSQTNPSPLFSAIRNHSSSASYSPPSVCAPQGSLSSPSFSKTRPLSANPSRLPPLNPPFHFCFPFTQLLTCSYPRAVTP